MALKSFRITKKELTNYYDPKTTEYEYMVNSINSPMGYGQVIQNYAGNGAEVLNTYYHIYSYKIGAPVVYYPTANVEVPELEAGPSFWGVSAQQGLNFLNGNSTILGYRKLKYCNGCLDGNGLNKPVIENFKQRFSQVNEMVLAYNLLEGFLFYDLALPKYQNVFPAVKVDDGVNVDYKFKNVSTGADLTPTDVSTITQKSVVDIETSVDRAPIIKPQEGANTVITSCCNEKVSFVISGQYQVGAILYTTDLTESYCWYVESLTKEEPTVSVTFTSGGRSCKQCVVTYGCPTGCEEVWLSYSSDPSDVCSQTQSSWAVDFTTNQLAYYNQGSSGELNCFAVPGPIGYYSDEATIWFWDQNNIIEYGKCSTVSNSIVQGCCDGSIYTISGVYPIGTVFYTKELDPATCFEVIDTTSKKPDAPFSNVSLWRGDCKGCTSSYSGGCK